MLPNADEGQKRIKKYLLENAKPEANTIPKEEEKPKKEYINDDSNEYDIHEDDTVEDKDW